MKAFPFQFKDRQEPDTLWEIVNSSGEVILRTRDFEEGKRLIESNRTLGIRATVVKGATAVSSTKLYTVWEINPNGTLSQITPARTFLEAQERREILVAMFPAKHYVIREVMF